MYPDSVNFNFRHSKIALLTKHEKELVIEPLLKHFLGTEIELINNYNTDVFGAFTRDIARKNSQIETLREKAKIAIEISGLDIGFASEGSFSIDPYYGMLPWNLEMVMLMDRKNNIEITGVAQKPYLAIQDKIATEEELLQIVNKINFPTNGLILRPNDEHDKTILKDSCNLEELVQNFYKCKTYSNNGIVFVENDCRAHKNIERMNVIELAVVNLLMKLHSFCPNCNFPGFWVSRGEPGLPCSNCGNETDITKYIVYTCSACKYEKLITRNDIDTVDLGNCNYCNP